MCGVFLEVQLMMKTNWQVRPDCQAFAACQSLHFPGQSLKDLCIETGDKSLVKSLGFYLTVGGIEVDGKQRERGMTYSIGSFPE